MMSNGIWNPTKQIEDNSMANNVHHSTSSALDSPLMKLSSYFLAVRPWSLSASLMPTLLGSALAYRLTGLASFSWISLIVIVFTVLCVHGAGNVVNTYFDYEKGVDSRQSDDRILVDHLLSKDELVSLGALLYTVGSLGFVLLTAISPAKMEHLALVYFAGLSSSFLYTGSIGFKYIALGDVLVLIIFGPVSVLFAFMAQTGYGELQTIYYAVPLALNTEAILHSNNTRDMESDKKAGIVTLAILIGHTTSHVLYAFLLFTPYIILIVLALKYSIWFLLPVITLPTAFKIEKDFRNPYKIQNVPKRTARLNMFLGILYVIACLLVA
ncbi:UbiA prenyltransferase domain-containing protein 1-like protein [Camponotus floridanus]|uniref:UbiA prenyltransferase domain-containing protein 1-like protein n=2 Tax=Camponotus floridanus TaxID=104421 RepID=E2A0T5_CAMFO|nr:ubiA prenyltransferase domain-containing protein 1 homolog isoform X2 [Camponotus floridanus]XP_019885505.1 ubiA prenyltransferase domain-containing protein 1 homolog isoform X2 [Camponotus floridanus]EFN72988.1 UbiA prenyltransferase domain-containing protein 1-like protein [Camponotus floridanus]